MHDRNGTPLRVGDIVLIAAKITSLQPGEDFCNVSAESLHGRRPDGQKETWYSFNTGTVVLCERGDIHDAPDTQRV